MNGTFILFFKNRYKKNRVKHWVEDKSDFMDIHGKVVIITGASSGIGLATARLLAAHGANLALVARSTKKIEALLHVLPNSEAVTADMTKIVEIKRMIKRIVEHFGRIDILINNAGQGYDAPVEKTDIAQFDYIFRLDVIGPLVAMQQVIPLMKKQGGGVIINISSGTALMHLPNMSAYSAMKRALADISITAREELKTDNITVSVVYPYITLTDFEKNTIKDPSLKENGEEEDTGRFPADTAEYVANKILEGIESGEVEIFAHDWMKKKASREDEGFPSGSVAPPVP
jgi:short-subunit dehydrogenase